MKATFQNLIVVGFAVSVMPALMAADVGGRPPLVEAARSGDKAAVRAQLQKKADVNLTEGDGSTALLWASYRNDIETADLLLRAGAKPNGANDLGVTPLWAAGENGNAAMVRKLLDAGANPNAPLAAGETPLMVAARSGYTEVVELLAAKGADVNARGTRGQTALMWAASQRHPEAVKVLLKHAADIHARSATRSEVVAVPPHGYLGYNRLLPEGGETALLFAVRSGDLESVKLLVEAGAKVNDSDAWGITATTLAGHAGFGEIVAFLLSKDADPNLAANGFTALHTAIMRRDEAMVNALLEHGANANAPLETWTPTRRASKDLNFAPELVGASPLWLAARFKEPNVMRLLLKHGAKANFVHHSDKVLEGKGNGVFPHRIEDTSVLMAAVGTSNGGAWEPVDRNRAETFALEAAKLLLEGGAEINAASPEGETALDAANKMGYKSVIQFLVSSGAKAGTAGNKNKMTGRDKGAVAEEPTEPK